MAAFLQADLSGAGGLAGGLDVDGQTQLSATLSGTGGLSGELAGGEYELSATASGTGGLAARLSGQLALAATAAGWGRLLSISPDLPTGGVAGDVVDLSDAFPVPIGLGLSAVLAQDPTPIDEGDTDADIDTGSDWGPDVIVFTDEDPDNP